MDSQQKQKQILFPQHSIVGFHFLDMKQVRTTLNTQARNRKLQSMTTWFILSGQDQKYNIMKCKVSPTCKAFIKLLYSPSQGFFVDSINNRHDHSQNTKLKQLKQHHILAPFIVIHNTYKLLLQNNPGQAAIAYDITNSKGQLILQNSKKFQQFTNNKAQFTVLMYALLDCHSHGITRIEFKNRSKLIVDYMNGLMKISAHGLRDIAQAAKLLASRIGGNVVYKVMDKSQSCVKLQNMCRKLLSMNSVESKLGL